MIITPTTIAESCTAAAGVALPDAVVQLLAHIEDVISDQDWEKIDVSLWNAVTRMGAVPVLEEGVAAPSKSVLDPQIEILTRLRPLTHVQFEHAKTVGKTLEGLTSALDTVIKYASRTAFANGMKAAGGGSVSPRAYFPVGAPPVHPMPDGWLDDYITCTARLNPGEMPGVYFVQGVRFAEKHYGVA